MQTPEQIAARLGCTVEQLKAGYARNAAAMRKDQAKAEATGKKVSGRTAAQWAADAEKMERLAK